jgi:hypothetical protein
MRTLMRRDGWPERLVATIERHRAEVFAWGSFDCATLFAECVAAVTGIDPLCDFERWTSERDALRVLSGSGFASMAAFCDHHFPAVPVSLARRGDLVLPAAAPPIMCPAVVIGAQAVSRDLSGFVVAPVEAMTHAWKVG